MAGCGAFSRPCAAAARSVWWACTCARFTLPADSAPEAVAALQAAEAWYSSRPRRIGVPPCRRRRRRVSIRRPRGRRSRCSGRAEAWRRPGRLPSCPGSVFALQRSPRRFCSPPCRQSRSSRNRSTAASSKPASTSHEGQRPPAAGLLGGVVARRESAA